MALTSNKKFDDQLDYYTFGEHDKHIFSSHGGKQRSKREVAVHTNRFDPSGHSRKISTKIRNTEKNACGKHSNQIDPNGHMRRIYKTQRCKKLNSPKKQRVADF